MVCIRLYTVLLYDTSPIHCTPLRVHPPLMNTPKQHVTHKLQDGRGSVRFGSVCMSTVFAVCAVYKFARFARTNGGSRFAVRAVRKTRWFTWFARKCGSPEIVVSPFCLSPSPSCLPPVSLLSPSLSPSCLCFLALWLVVVPAVRGQN